MGITSMSEDYNKYGGSGWKCLNDKTVVKHAEAGIAPVVEWIPGNYFIETSKSENAAKETRYKCVVLYNNTVISKEITITNYSSQYDITIESDAGTKFYYDIGTPTLTCKINGSEKTGNEFEYI